MVGRLLRTEEAHADLLAIWQYIAHERSAPVADAVLARIRGAMEMLAFAPQIGRRRPEFAGSPRSMAVRPYVIFYEPLPEDDGIIVWRVLHGARDLQRVVRPPFES